jgi:GNAT superfamily N-acetyltransferase
MSGKILISTDKNLVTPQEVADLYIELGWGTKKEYSVARMATSLANCDIVIFARNEDGELIGIGRALSDFAIDTKILDLIITPDYQRQGLGLKMMEKIAVLAKGTSIYFETERKNFAFAKKSGYTKRAGLTVFRKKG